MSDRKDILDQLTALRSDPLGIASLEFVVELLDLVTAEITKLRAEADERDRSFAIFFRHYLRVLAEVEDGPDKADLLQMIREQAATIREYQAGRSGTGDTNVMGR